VGDFPIILMKKLQLKREFLFWVASKSRAIFTSWLTVQFYVRCQTLVAVPLPGEHRCLFRAEGVGPVQLCSGRPWGLRCSVVVKPLPAV